MVLRNSTPGMTNLAILNSRDEDWMNSNLLFKGRFFACRPLPRIVKVPGVKTRTLRVKRVHWGKLAARAVHWVHIICGRELSHCISSGFVFDTGLFKSCIPTVRSWIHFREGKSDNHKRRFKVCFAFPGRLFISTPESASFPVVPGQPRSQTCLELSRSSPGFFRSPG